MVHSMNTSMPIATALFWSVRIISRPVRSPTCARRAYLCPPKTTTSKACVVVISGDPPWIVEDAHREKADVEVGEGDDDEAGPGPARVPRVQAVRERPEPEAQRLSVEAVEIAPEEIAHRVAGERVAGEEQDVREHDERPEP